MQIAYKKGTNLPNEAAIHKMSDLVAKSGCLNNKHQYDPINSKGDCFYQVLNYGLFANKSTPHLVRQFIAYKFLSYPELMVGFPNISSNQYQALIAEDGFYAGDIEINVVRKTFPEMNLITVNEDGSIYGEDNIINPSLLSLIIIMDKRARHFILWSIVNPAPFDISRILIAFEPASDFLYFNFCPNCVCAYYKSMPKCEILEHFFECCHSAESGKTVIEAYTEKWMDTQKNNKQMSFTELFKF